MMIRAVVVCGVGLALHTLVPSAPPGAKEKNPISSYFFLGGYRLVFFLLRNEEEAALFKRKVHKGTKTISTDICSICSAIHP